MKGEQLSLFDDMGPGMAMQCPFVGRKVVATGSFQQGRQGLRNLLVRLGANEVRFDKLQRNTHYLLVGENPDMEVINYWRLYVHDGYNICRIDSDDLQKIQDGVYAPYQTAEEMVKELHLTKEHVYWNAPDITGLKNQRQISPVALNSDNILYNKEIYVHTSLLDASPELGQVLGCLGAYANTEMAEDTDCILMPGTMPAEICQAVEKHYNTGKATQFNTPFIILEELREYLKRHLRDYPDDVLEELTLAI